MTSIPASRSARAMIFAPRSWPSSPGLATRILSFLSDTFSDTLRSHDQVHRLRAVRALVDAAVHPQHLQACLLDERNHLVAEIVTDEVARDHDAALRRDERALCEVAPRLGVEA